MALPNLWRLYNLRSSPFFQATLRQDAEAYAYYCMGFGAIATLINIVAP